MHTKKTLIILVGLLLISTGLVGAYTSVSGINLPDVPVTMNAVNPGTTTYFDITLSGVPAGHDVTNGVYPGWCADNSIFMLHIDLEVTLYDSYGSLPAVVQDDDWDKVNWILNNKGSYAMMDIQRAIWHFLNEVPYSELTANAQDLVDDANANGNGFTYQSGDIIAIIAVPTRTDTQCAFIELVMPCNEGKTHGYWKKHLSSWPAPYTPSNLVGSVFTIPSYCSGLGGDTLLDALKYHGGNNDIGAARILLRNAVAAFLNAVHPNINYPLTPSALIDDVNTALASQDRTTMLNLEEILDDYNNLGADLSD